MAPNGYSNVFLAGINRDLVRALAAPKLAGPRTSANRRETDVPDLVLGKARSQRCVVRLGGGTSAPRCLGGGTSAPRHLRACPTDQAARNPHTAVYQAAGDE